MTPTKAALDDALLVADEALNAPELDGHLSRMLVMMLTGGHLDVLVKAVKQALTANTWRDIKDAPRDGTVVMVFCQYDDEPQIARFRHGKWEIMSDGKHAISYMSDFGSDYCYADNPTHWKPLDKPEQPPC